MDLPLFPLKTVLFPGGSLPLHIFEERYKQMLGDCIAANSPFGVVLIKSGQEVGGGAEPFPVGTTARVTRVQHLDDGGMNLIAVGRDRFRIDEITQRYPFMRARVEILQETDVDSPSTATQAGEVAALYTDYYRLALNLTDQWQRRVSIPAAPDSLADFIASHVDAGMQLKQQLLETLSVGDRLTTEHKMLSEANALLSAQVTVARRQKYDSSAALN